MSCLCGNLHSFLEGGPEERKKGREGGEGAGLGSRSWAGEAVSYQCGWRGWDSQDSMSIYIKGVVLLVIILYHINWCSVSLMRTDDCNT